MMMEHVRTATNIFLLSNLVIAVVSSSFYTFFTMVFVCNMIQYLIWSSIDKQNDINVNNYNLIFKDQIADLEDFRDRYHHVMNLAVKSHDAHLVDLVKRLDSYDEEKKCFKWDVESEDVVESWPSTPPAESPESDSDSLIVHRENVSDDPEVDKYLLCLLKNNSIKLVVTSKILLRMLLKKCQICLVIAKISIQNSMRNFQNPLWPALIKIEYYIQIIGIHTK